MAGIALTAVVRSTTDLCTRLCNNAERPPLRRFLSPPLPVHLSASISPRHSFHQPLGFENPQAVIVPLFFLVSINLLFNNWAKDQVRQLARIRACSLMRTQPGLTIGLIRSRASQLVVEHLACWERASDGRLSSSANFDEKKQ